MERYRLRHRLLLEPLKAPINRNEKLLLRLQLQLLLLLLRRSRACTRASAFIWKLEVSVGAASVGVYREGCCHRGVDQSIALKKSCERTCAGQGAG